MKTPMPQRYKQIARIVLSIIACGLILYFVLARIGNIRDGIVRILDIIFPFLLGALIAFLLKPLCNLLDARLGDLFVKRLARRRIESGKTNEKRVRRHAEHVSILISVLAFFLLLAGIVMLVVPSLFSSLVSLKNDFPTYLNNLSTWVESINRPGNPIGQAIYKIYDSIRNSISAPGDSFLSHLIDNYQNLLNTAGKVISAVLSFLVDLLVTVVSAVYILFNRKRFAAQCNMMVRAAFKKPVADWLVKEAQFTNRKFSEFFTGKLLDSFIVGCILYIAFSIFKIPQAPLIAVFMAFCNMIPFFGPFIGAFPCLFIVLMADISHPINVLYFLIIVVAVQQLDGNILDPFIVGDNIGLPSFWVLFAVILFGDLFGFIGMLLGVPVFAVLYDLIRQLVNCGLKRRGEEQLMTNYNFIYHDPEEEREARKKRAAAIKAARKEARAKESAERAEILERELAIAQAAAVARAEAEAEAEAKAQAEEQAQAADTATDSEAPACDTEEKAADGQTATADVPANGASRTE